EARGELPVEVLDQAPAGGVAVQGDVAGVAQAGARPFAVLHGEGVLPAEEVGLLVLRGEGPAAMGVAAVRLVDVAEAELQAAAGVGLETADVEVVAVDVGFLPETVLAREGVAVLEIAQFHVLDAGAGGALVPVVEIGDVDVVALVV